MIKKAKISLLASVLIGTLPLPVTSALVEPMMGMGVLILYFFFVMPAFFVFLGAYLAPVWKKLWWVPLIAVGVFVLTGVLWAETWDFAAYAPVYLVIGYGTMAIGAFAQSRKKKNEQTKMDIQDL